MYRAPYRSSDLAIKDSKALLSIMPPCTILLFFDKNHAHSTIAHSYSYIRVWCIDLLWCTMHNVPDCTLWKFSRTTTLTASIFGHFLQFDISTLHHFSEVTSINKEKTKKKVLLGGLVHDSIHVHIHYLLAGPLIPSQLAGSLPLPITSSLILMVQSLTH